MQRAQKFLIAGMIDEGHQMVKKSADVEDAHRFAVIAQLQPGQRLEQFIKRAVAAGEGDEAVGEISHQRFALVHVLHHMHFGDASMADFLVHQQLRDDADHLAAGGQAGIGRDAHQADAAATVNQADFALCKSVSKMGGGFAIDRIGAGTGAAVKTNGI